MKGRVHLSRDCADQLIAHGKRDWLQKREDKVVAKGKGEMETFFLNMAATDAKSSSGMSSGTDFSETSFTNVSAGQSQSDRLVASLSSEKVTSLVKWNVEMLSRFLKQIVAQRDDMGGSPNDGSLFVDELPHGIPIDEVVEVIDLPRANLPEDGIKLSSVALPAAAKAPSACPNGGQ